MVLVDSTVHSGFIFFGTQRSPYNHSMANFVTQIAPLVSSGIDGLSDLVDDVAHGACDVGDAGGESLVHIGRQVLDVGDELLHLAEGADHLQGRAQLAAVCQRTQGLQQIQLRSLCGGNQEIAPSKSMQHDIIYVFSCRGKKEFSILLNKVTFNTFQ